MPSPARKFINDTAIPEFAKLFKKGDSILFVGVSRPFGYLYRQIFQDMFYVTLDIKPETRPDIVGDIQDPTLSDESFDGIVMVGVYEYLSEPKKAFEAIHRLLKDDGWALICLPGPGYYHDKPTVRPETASEVVVPMVVKKIDTTYYKNDNPYYIHLLCQKR